MSSDEAESVAGVEQDVEEAVVMQTGFAFLEAGAVRSKNTTNILIKNMLDASTAATIVSGSVAERCQFFAYFVYSTGITEQSNDCSSATNNPLIVLQAQVVHLTGGVASLVAASMLGPRIGRFDNGKVNELRGHSVPLAALGGFILLFGFLAFNGGSQGSISHPGDGQVVSHAIVNTVIAGSSGGLAMLLISRRRVTRHWSFLMSLNGALAGMVSICSACHSMPPWGAFITGLSGAFAFTLIHLLMLRFEIDDPLDAVAVHAGGGLCGLICGAIFAEEGLLLNGNFTILFWNIAGAFAIVIWSGGFSILMFGALKLTKFFRVEGSVEERGMDILKHDEPAYPVESWMEQQYFANGRILPLGAANVPGKTSQIELKQGGRSSVVSIEETAPRTRYPMFPTLNVTETFDTQSGPRSISREVGTVATANGDIVELELQDDDAPHTQSLPAAGMAVSVRLKQKPGTQKQFSYENPAYWREKSIKDNQEF
ncbi:unnamed protein product [Cyprideis torosa]|uniref:Uncharacterized protein n=1 Tax=Cyprideis torosa TaxID=163714 RepID=A0A7R8WAB9_9CRUS|nr:unnamed protein product [Cyprideis torosa]CAG0890752.1 unnamed protein product [Cyprideis torosa]